MSSTQPQPVATLVEHFFRHEAGRLVSVLTRIFGWRNFDLVEDMVQDTLADALQSWRVRGVPDNPSGWVHRIAKNKILDALRRNKINERVIGELAATRPPSFSPPSFGGEIQRGARRAVSRFGDRGQPVADDLCLLPSTAGAREPAGFDLESLVRLRQLGNRPRPPRGRRGGQEAPPARHPGQ